MANNQPLASGDGPADPIDSNLKSGSSSPWTNLPLLVHYVLGSKMDTKGIRDMRLVCTEWQKNVEKCVGLKVKVDDSIEGNLEFVRRVKVGSARVQSWAVDIGTEPASLLFQYPDWLKKLKLCGKMPAQWKIHDLRRFPSLAHLVLRNRVLHSNHLTGHQYPVISFDLTSELSPNHAVVEAYRTQDLPSEPEPIELKSLQTLEIIKYDYRTNRTFSELPTHSYLVMMTNLCFILSHVTSPLLSVVHLTVSVPEGLLTINPYNKFNWTLVPLHRFLKNHRSTLRQLILPGLPTKSSELIENENLSNSFPMNLQKLMLQLEGPRDDLREEPDQSTFAYLQKCFQQLTQLQDIHFSFNYFPVKWTSDAFTWLANSCSRTLRYLELQGFSNDRATSLDLQMLSVCQCLEVLHLPWWEGGTCLTIRNVDKLPASLKILFIFSSARDGHLELGDPTFFKRLTVLEWISLGRIRLPGASLDGNQEPHREFCRTMIKGLLGLRQLEGFHLEVPGVALNTDRNLVALLGSLDQRIIPASQYPQNRVKYNLKYPSYNVTREPWSDKPFDIETWDLEKYRD